MSLNDLFSFVRPEERRQRMVDFERRVFPLGMEQRTAALEALRPLISPKVDDTELLYAFISAKEKYVISSSEEGVRDYLRRQKHLTDKDKAYIAALIFMDVKVKDLADYPTSEDIKGRV